MAATPVIRSAIGTWDTYAGTTILAMIENSGTGGMVQFKVGDKISGVCVEVTSKESCLSPPNQYINGLYSRVLFNRIGAGTVGCLRAYYCSVGDSCPTCVTYNTSASSVYDNIIIDQGLGITPNPVSALTLVPGDSSITVSWTPPSNAPIFAYHIRLWQSATTLLADGYVQTTSKTINNLTNGVSYTIEVTALSDDAFDGQALSQSATPGGVTSTGDACMKSNPGGASIIVDGTARAGKTTAISTSACVASNIVTGLTVGSHSLRFTLAGYQDVVGNFTVAAGQIVNVDAGALVPISNGGGGGSTTPAASQGSSSGLIIGLVVLAALAAAVIMKKSGGR